MFKKLISIFAAALFFNLGAGDAAVFVPGVQGTNELKNPSFETSGSWEPYGGGFRRDNTVSHSGGWSILCDTGGRDGVVGAVQYINYEKPDVRPVFFGGWSRAEKLKSLEYSLYIDIIFDDGTMGRPHVASWEFTPQEWTYLAASFIPQKPIKQIRCYLLLRTGGGKVWFDDIEVARDVDPALAGLVPRGVRVNTDYPCSDGWIATGKLSDRDVAWECRLVAGERIVASEKGVGGSIRFHYHPQPGEPGPEQMILLTSKGAKTFRTSLPLPSRREQPVTERSLWQVVPASRKVYPDSPIPSSPVRHIDLALAGNERENVQIALRLADSSPARPCTLTVTPFSTDGGAVLPAERIRSYFVANIWCPTPSHHPANPYSDRPRWTPEVLLPGQRFWVRGGYTQAFQLEVSSRPDEKPGIYRGTVKLELENPAEIIEIPASLEVFGFSLPQRPAMRTAFAQMDGYTRCIYPEIVPELRRKLIDIMLDYRLAADDISRIAPPSPDDLAYQDARINDFCVTNLVTPIRKGQNPLWKCISGVSEYNDGFYRELATRLDEFYAQMQKLNLNAQGYVYGFDERKKEYEEAIHRSFRFIKERYPALKTFTTAYFTYAKRAEMPDNFEDWVDWYCPLTDKYDPALSRRLRKLGKEVWWYVCLSPLYPYANFAAVDYPAVEGRILAWQAFHFESDGLLFWHVNRDWDKNAPIRDAVPFLTDWRAIDHVASADGNLIYPTPDGPVPSVRLVNIRDGIEDFEYLTMLAKLKGRRAVVPYLKQLVPSMTDFSRDSALLEKMRREIGRTIGEHQ